MLPDCVRHPLPAKIHANDRPTMFGSKKHSPEIHAIDASMQITGDCQFQGSLQLDGTVLGNLIASAEQTSSIHIGPTGRVQGNVSADDVVVAGTIIGAVSAAQHLVVLETARIEGDVSYQAMNLAPGATVIGLLQPRPLIIPPPDSDTAPAAAKREQHSGSAASAPEEITEPTMEPHMDPPLVDSEPPEPTLDLEQPLRGEEEPVS